MAGEGAGRGTPPPVFAEVWQTKDFKFFRWEVWQGKGLEGDLLDVWQQWSCGWGRMETDQEKMTKWQKNAGKGDA